MLAKNSNIYPIGRGWQYHLKDMEQNSYSYLLSVHWTNRCQVTVIPSWQALKNTAVSWHLFVWCILRKELKQSCPLYLICHFKRPPLGKKCLKAFGTWSTEDTVLNGLHLLCCLLGGRIWWRWRVREDIVWSSRYFYSFIIWSRWLIKIRMILINQIKGSLKELCSDGDPGKVFM